MNTQAEYQAEAQSIVDTIGPMLRDIESHMMDSLAKSFEFKQKAKRGEIPDLTLDANEIHKLNKEFWRKLARAHETAVDLCEESGLNEGK